MCFQILVRQALPVPRGLCLILIRTDTEKTMPFENWIGFSVQKHRHFAAHVAFLQKTMFFEKWIMFSSGIAMFLTIRIDSPYKKHKHVAADRGFPIRNQWFLNIEFHCQLRKHKDFGAHVETNPLAPTS